MLPSYAHLNIEERERLFGWRKGGVSLRDIAKGLKRNVSTVSRELKRNTRYGRDYLPCLAQKRAERVAKEQRYQAPLKNPEIFLYVREKLRKPYLWSPEIIAGRIKQEVKGAAINPETIYRYIYSKRGRRYKLWENLECGRQKRKRKLGRKVHNRGKVPNALSIDLRPKYILKWRQPGHWETDNVEGIRTSKPALSVCVERSLRLVALTRLPNQTAKAKTQALKRKLKSLPPELRLSLTQDNGKENYGHEETGKELGMAMYFCHAYHSWEKGSVENRNRKIRRFFPKGTDFTGVSEDEIAAVEYYLNNRPMKCLDYSTPYEKMQQLLSKLQST